MIAQIREFFYHIIDFNIYFYLYELKNFIIYTININYQEHMIRSYVALSKLKACHFKCILTYEFISANLNM